MAIEKPYYKQDGETWEKFAKRMNADGVERFSIGQRVTPRFREQGYDVESPCYDESKGCLRCHISLNPCEPANYCEDCQLALQAGERIRKSIDSIQYSAIHPRLREELVFELHIALTELHLNQFIFNSEESEVKSND